MRCEANLRWDEKMDIDAAFNRIIFKYHLDRYYPHYKNMNGAERVLRDIIKTIKKNSRKAIFVGDDKSGIRYIQNIAREYSGIHFLFYNRYDVELTQLESVDWKGCEIYLISFYGAEYIERWFRQHKIQYRWIYDIFEQNGFSLQREFFLFGKEDMYDLVGLGSRKRKQDLCAGSKEYIQCELYCQQNKYENSDNVETKRVAFEKSFFLALYMRNFTEAQKYIPELSQYDKKFESAWNEIQDLLSIIREKVAGRLQKDVILYWLDSLPYGAEKAMPYLSDVFNHSVLFENAYTYIPYTHPTFRAMFLGKKDIDDLAYRIPKVTAENSPLIRFLEEQGYK